MRTTPGSTSRLKTSSSYDGGSPGRHTPLDLAVFQKNDPDQAKALEPYFDGVLDEQCNEYSECSAFQTYLRAGKPVLNAEYNLSTSQFCAADNRAGIMGALYDVNLDGSTYQPCWSGSPVSVRPVSLAGESRSPRDP